MDVRLWVVRSDKSCALAYHSLPKNAIIGPLQNTTFVGRNEHYIMLRRQAPVYFSNESAPSSSVCGVSCTQRNSSTRLQEATTSSRVIAAAPGSSATLQPNSKHRETTFGIDEDCWRSSSAAMLTNGKAQLVRFFSLILNLK
ncbi:unnamed protein product [Acanthocheilonema viteae]|uniref:Uncharacterized protein n=1 Tax=Acanthocheilonema viteae TaxID=6277 RepID=A0A498SM77_ACAVI|nr:unnamed protein product [Acanthocheilonema viteae]